MSGLRRYARWIALLAVVGMLLPFLSQGIGTVLAMDPLFVAVILLAVIGFVLTWAVLTRSTGEEEQ